MSVLSALTAYNIRYELQRALINELLGPAGGPEEEILTDLEPRMNNRYLVGMLLPEPEGNR